MLVVDDSDDNVSWVRLVLELDGATVFFASSATKALEVLENVIVDVLMTELELPDMDGFELLRIVRETRTHENADVPAIAMSAAAINDSRARAYEAGFAVYVVKPLLAETMVDAVGVLVGR